VLTLDRPLVMGVLNVTPDSFSDGGRHDTPEAAVSHAERLVAEGADIVDVGGESTRPQGAMPVSAEEEMRRVVPVVHAISARWPELVISVDTVKSEVAEAALGAGAHVVNDVSGARLDAAMPAVCAAAGAGLVVMHSRGDVSDMATFAHAEYHGDVVDVVLGEVRDRVVHAEKAGVPRACIAVDPGIGFAKRAPQSLRLLACLQRLAGWGYPVVVGASRKRFIGELTKVSRAEDRVFGSVGAAVSAYERGAHILRVHDVAPTRHALDVALAIRRAGAPE
jgi:dihydropteroate synthase